MPRPRCFADTARVALPCSTAIGMTDRMTNRDRYDPELLLPPVWLRLGRRVSTGAYPYGVYGGVRERDGGLRVSFKKIDDCLAHTFCFDMRHP
jgi:hypothetical protein